ncbi:TonB-dependent siderophore receptor [uncultured Anaerovibrio sp.]|uniref:TonB-dependent receptor plug domain-containing protein n=1 Tax=uncultured Anaerovibrio sp. TaxID=361586 RepID=UPI0025D1FEA4|nr:TonB-dependent receptor [uncultured Anaerovibrio sp.]
MKNELANKVLASLAVGVLCSSVAVCQAAGVENDDIVDVVVTAERMPSSRMSTPADVTVITAQQIEDNHYADVAEALQHVNGVVVNNGNANGDQEVVINGDQRVVVLIDGQRLNNAQGSMTRATVSLGMIPSVKNIERIEVVKGAGSALYGSDAVGGVVNIITKKGTTPETTLDLNTGSYGAHNYELSNQGSDGNFSWFVTAGLQRRSYFKYKKDGEDVQMKNSDYGKTSFSLRLDQKLTDNSSLRFNFNHRQLDMGVYDNNYRQEHNYNNGSLTYSFKENQPVQGFLRLFANYKSTEYQGAFDTNTRGIEYQNGWQLGDHKLVAGAEWQRSTSTNAPSGYEDKESTQSALYLQDTMKLSTKWIFIPGLRMDRHDAFGTHWSPKAAFNYQATNKTRAYASWGRVFKAPTADDLFYYIDMSMWGYGKYIGNPDLKPESGHVETIGFTHEFSEKAVLDMSYFWSNMSDAIIWSPVPGTDEQTPTNVNREKKHGINLTFNGKLSDNWSYEAGYSYINTWTNGTDSKSQTLIHYYEPNGYRLGIHYKNDRWKANLEARMGSGLDKANYGCNNYAIWNFNTTYSATQNVDIYFRINNLTNQVYNTYVRNKHPLQGRFIQLGVNVKF